jgi:galactokinase
VAPGRVNLIGEHTDYNDGLVMPLAIQHCCAAAVSPRDDDRLHIIAADLPAEERVFECELARLDRDLLRGRWPAYVAGPAAILAERLGSHGGVNITIASDVPRGAGLSSSAAAEVATATALAAIWRIDVAPLELARLCQRAEHEWAGVPCGLMDQLASVFGREGHALMIDCRSNGIEPIPLLPPERIALIVTNSGVRHSLAAGEYASRRAACEAAARGMGIGSMRDATPEMIEAASLEYEQRNCAAHVVAENGRVREFAAAIRAGDLAAAGSLMYASHASLRDLYHVSCPELDTLVEIAREVPGVYGSRMTGGGFGGCTITLCEPAAVERLNRELHSRYRAAHNRECTAFAVRPSAGARVVDANEPAH